MKRYAAISAGIIFVLAITATWEMARAADDDLVGPSGDLAKLKIDGVTKEKADAIRSGLQLCPQLLLLIAPSAPAKPFREALEKALIEGYLGDGYPDVKVRVSQNGGDLRVTVEEGKRYVNGDVELEIKDVADARNVDSQVIIRALKTEQPGGFMNAGFAEFDEKKIEIDLSSDHIDGGIPWKAGDPAGFNESCLQSIKDQIRDQLARQGYFWADVDVRMNRDGDKATLHATVDRLGPRAKIKSIAINGLKVFHESQVTDFLNLKVGGTPTLDDLIGCVRKLFDSACFVKHSMTVDLAQEGFLDVRLDVEETTSPRELGAPWTPTEQALLNLCNYVQHLDQEKDDFVWESGTPDGPIALHAVANSGHGCYVAVSLNSHQPRLVGNMDVLLTREALGADSSVTGRRIFVTAQAPWRMIIKLAMENNALSIGGTIATRNEDLPPLEYEIYAPPAAFLHLVHDEKLKVSVRDGILRLETTQTVITVDAKTGRLREIVASDEKKNVVGRGYLKAGALAELQQKMKGRPEINAYDSAHPLAGAIAYGCEAVAGLGTLTSTNQDSAKAAARLRGISKLFGSQFIEQIDQRIQTLLAGNVAGQDSFNVPADTSAFKDMQLLQRAAYMFAPWMATSYPYGSWPETLLREGSLTVAGKNRNGVTELKRIYNDDKMGPVGFLLYAEALHFASPQQEAAFAARGIERLNADAFANDLHTLLDGDALGPVALRQFLKNLSQLTPEELTANTEYLPKDVQEMVAAVYLAVKAAGPAGVQDLPEIAQALWPAIKPNIEAALQRHVPARATAQVVAPAPTATTIVPNGAYNIQETLLGPMDMEISNPVYSRDGRHFAYVATRGQQRVVVVDGLAGAQYDAVPDGSLIFSTDGTRVAYAARKGAKQFVVVDGSEGDAFDGMGQGFLTFSPDNKRFAYMAGRGGNRFVVVVDGQAGEEFDGIAKGSLIFSPDSNRMAYGAMKGPKELVLVDGHAGTEFDGILDGTPIFSPDSKHVAYAAKVGQKWWVVVDGDRSAEYDGIGRGYPVFSPDSKHLAYVAWKDAKQLVVVDGQAGAEFDAIANGTPIFSPNGQRIAYETRNGHEWHMVLDSRQGDMFDGIAQDAVFSPDSKRFAYAAQENGKELVVVDGQSGDVFDGIGQGSPVFSPDSKRIAYTAMKDGKQLVVVDGHAGPAYDGIARSGPVFSPDSRHVVYLAQNNGKEFVVFDGQADAEFGKIIDGTLALSPDSNHLAYVADTDTARVVVVDGKVGAGFDGIHGVPIFSQDSKHVAYVALKGSKRQVVEDGQAGTPYERIIDNSPTFQPDGTLEYLAVRENSLYRVEYALRKPSQ